MFTFNDKSHTVTTHLLASHYIAVNKEYLTITQIIFGLVE